MPLQEPSKIWHLGRWIYKPEPLGKKPTSDEQEIYDYHIKIWNQLIRQSPYYFELKQAEKDRKKINAQRGSNNRRAKMKKAFIEDVIPMRVFNRDKWICQICGHAVSKLRDRNLIDIASLDHIIPISKGGKHSYENTQLAHLSCNLRKSSSMPIDKGNASRPRNDC